MENRKYNEEITDVKKEEFIEEYTKYIHGFYDEVYVDGVEDYKECN